MARSKRTSAPRARRANPTAEVHLRIIGGKYGGRKLAYSGDPRTRPMKERVREAIFNLLGPAIVGKHAVDLFAGTGALGLEALSRGAARATLVERHFPTVELIRRNVAALGAEESAQVVGADTFLWAREHALGTDNPWAVFCSPPYDFYADRRRDMVILIDAFVRAAPAESVVVVEADGRLKFDTLPRPDAWDVRRYPPAVVGLLWT